MIKVIVEGYSENSEDQALADAMAKAARYLSSDHDVSIAILELAQLPGRGFKAVLEITITPMTRKDTLHREGQDLELQRLYNADYKARKKYAEQHWKREMANQFVRTMGTNCPDIPDFLAVTIDEAGLLNRRIEKEFFYASHRSGRIDIPFQEPEVPSLKDVLGKKNRYRGPDREPE